MAELGAEPVICGRRAEVVERTAAEISELHGVAATGITCDIRDAAAVEAMFDRIFEDGPLSGLVNNAAGNFIARTETLSPRAIDSILNIVLHGTFYCSVAAGRRWISGGLPGSSSASDRQQAISAVPSPCLRLRRRRACRH